jgi:hypothetical protein
VETAQVGLIMGNLDCILGLSRRRRRANNRVAKDKENPEATKRKSTESKVVYREA